MTDTIQDAIVREGIALDAAFVGHLSRDLVSTKHASFAGVVPLCMAPYLSLFAHESYRKLQASDPALASLLSSDVQSIVARSRHSLKLFEDTRRGVDGLLAYFRDELLPAHKGQFLGNTWLPLARFLETDLGLFSYDRRLIATTHAANFHVGMEPGELLEQTGARARAIYEEYGRYFAHLGARLDGDDETFMASLDSKRFNQRPDDVRADKYYGRVFDGPANPDVNALLTVFRGMLNFVSTVMSAGRVGEGIDYTIFKIRYLALYQVLGSLDALREARTGTLTSRSMNYIWQMLDSPEARLIMEPGAKPFRDALMHYAVDSRVDSEILDIAQPLFGLIPAYFPAYDPADFALTVDRCISQTATSFDEWSDLKT